MSFNNSKGRVCMQVSFNPNLSFKEQYPTLQSMSHYVGYVPMQAKPAVPEPQDDRSELEALRAKVEALEAKAAEQPKPKKASFIRRAISGVAKFFATVGQMIKATGKALFYGTTTAVSTLAVAWLAGPLPRAIKAGNVAEVLKHPVKNIGKAGKIVTGVLTAGVMALHLIKGWLKSNEKTANIDHRWKTGHREG